jgi:hypothetical protein
MTSLHNKGFANMAKRNGQKSTISFADPVVLFDFMRSPHSPQPVIYAGDS